MRLPPRLLRPLRRYGAIALGGIAVVTIVTWVWATAFYNILREDAERAARGWEVYVSRSVESLATSQDPSLRNGDMAIELSQRLCVETSWKDPLGLLLLASSHAEADDFKNAVKWATRALKYATPDVEADCRARLALFQAGKPYRRTSLGVD